MKNLFKLIILFLCLVIGINTASAKNISFTVISDANVSADKTENKMTPSIKNLLLAVEQVNTGTSNFVVFLGDNISSAGRINLAMFSKIIKKSKKPTFVTIGNKDLSKSRGLEKKEYFRILNKYSDNKIKTVPSYVKYEDYILVFMSGVNETINSNRGYYKTAELDFLDKTLTKFQDKKVIIFQHFPIVAETSEDSMKATVKPDEYLKVLKKYDNVIAVIAGHYNKEGMIEQDGIKYINVSSLGQSKEYNQIKIFKNNNGSYTITTRVFDIIGN